jgi:O-antigen/teichoic acid export membrane protein
VAPVFIPNKMCRPELGIRAVGSAFRESILVVLTEATFKGIVWIFGSEGVQAVLRVLVIALMARLIGPESFGLMAAAVVVLSLGDILSQVGTSAALVQSREITERHIGSAYILSAAIGTGLGLALWFSRDLIEDGLAMSGLGEILKALAWVLPVSAIGKPASRLLQRELKFRYIALAESGSYFVGWVVVGLGLALLGLDVWALVAAHGVATLSLALSMLVASRASITVQSSWAATRDLVSFGGGVSLSTVLLFIGMNLDRLFIGHAFGAYQLGLYSRAFDLMGRVYTVSDNTISKTLFPAFSSRQDQAARLKPAYFRAMKIVGLACLTIAGVTVVLSEEIVTLLFGRRWLEASPILQVAILILLPRVVGKLSATLAFGLGKAYPVAGIRFAYALLALTGLWLTSSHSVLLTAQVILFVEVGHAGMLTYLSLRLLGEPLSFLARQFASWIPFTALVLVLALLVKSVALHLDVGGISVLVTVCAAVALGSVLCTRLAPQLFIGDEGLWVLHRVGWPYGRQK